MSVKKTSSNNNVIIGKNIRKEREQHNHSQEFLANALNYSGNHLSSIERGLRTPTLEFLSRLSAYYGKSIDYFCRGTDFKYQIPENCQVIATLIAEIDNKGYKHIESFTKYIWEMQHNGQDVEKRIQKILDDIENNPSDNNKSED